MRCTQVIVGLGTDRCNLLRDTASELGQEGVDPMRHSVRLAFSRVSLVVIDAA
jgi:hypothetical protein